MRRRRRREPQWTGLTKDQRDEIADVFARYGITEVYYSESPGEIVFSVSREDYARLDEQASMREVARLMRFTSKTGTVPAGRVEGYHRLRPRPRPGGGGYARRGAPGGS